MSGWRYGLCLGLLWIMVGCAHQPPVSRKQTHVVQEGETLYAIARRYQVSVQAISQENRLADPTRIYPGQVLWIPGGAHTADAVPNKVASSDPKHVEKASRPARLPKEPEPPQTTNQSPTLKHTKKEYPLSCSASPKQAKLRDISKAGLGWPVEGIVVAKFGKWEDRRNDGLQIAAPKGMPIRAAKEGVVLFAGEQKGYGRLVVVEHPCGRVSIYARTAKTCVKDGDQVKRGQLVALVGESGGATSPHLYFELRENGEPINPQSRLPR